MTPGLCSYLPGPGAWNAYVFGTGQVSVENLGSFCEKGRSAIFWSDFIRER